MDFYRELGELFAVPLAAHHRWAGFKALRTRWADHVGSSRCRPVLIIDEAQEALTTVLSIFEPSCVNTSSTTTTSATTKVSTTSSRYRSGNLAKERSDATNASAAS